MKKYLVLTFFLNIIFFTYAYGLLGLALAVGLTGLVYFFAQAKLSSNRKEMATKIMFLVPHVLGIFAAQKLFQSSELTLMVGMMEIVIFFIFSSFNF